VSGAVRKPGRVFIRPPRASDEGKYLEGVRLSRKLHRPWVSPVASPKAFRGKLAGRNIPTRASFFVFLRESKALAGVVDLSEIVRGCFKSAYLGYFAFEPHAGRGFMRQGMAQVIDFAFAEMGLHRLEANIQPGNDSSRALVKALGFRQEGYSPRYLKVNRRWKDHERWAILAEEWKRAGSARSKGG
jgi:ribosomal-protein-alanine N-acetyltransferase